MRSDSVKNVSAYADQNHAPSLAAARLEITKKEGREMTDREYMLRAIRLAKKEQDTAVYGSDHRTEDQKSGDWFQGSESKGGRERCTDIA